MRILYASERPPFPFFLGGAARAVHMLLLRMAEISGAQCRAVGSKEYGVSAWDYPGEGEYATLGVRSVDRDRSWIDCGYRIALLSDFSHVLAAEIERFRPDIVWTQLEGALEVLQAADRLGVTGLCYVHDAEFDRAEMRQIASLDCHLIASSRFLANKVYAATGRRAEPVYPPAELYFDTRGNPDGLVTMINVHPVKGLDTFIEIARRLPAIDFLLQESWKLGESALESLGLRLADLSNIRFERRVSDMRSVYCQTRLLLMPSRWEEGFGMVALEAQSCGIPVIASRRGGLPESVGDGGLLIDDYRNVDAWVDAIGTVLKDASRYRTLADRARRHAASEAFASEALARRLLAIVQSAPKQAGRLERIAFRLRLRVRGHPLFGRIVRSRVG